jgi:hypothetical protein
MYVCMYVCMCVCVCVCVCVCIANAHKECDLLHDRSVLSTDRTLHDKQNSNCIDYDQNLIMSPGRQLQSDSDSKWIYIYTMLICWGMSLR